MKIIFQKNTLDYLFKKIIKYKIKFTSFRKDKNNNLIVNKRGKYKCSIILNDKIFLCSYGLKGFGKEKEGDNKTPLGIFELGDIYYRKDKLGNLAKLNKEKKIIPIKINSGWGGEINNYNQYIEFDKDSKEFKKAIENDFNEIGNNERLWRPKDNLYDIIIPIYYNKENIFGLGSAIFLHIARKGYSSTRGCIAVNENDMKEIICKINKETKIIIKSK